MFILAQATSRAVAEEREWRALYDCLDIHKYDVARYIVSLDEGAELITLILCSKQNTDLVNILVSTRNDNIGTQDYSSRFSTYLSVVKREIKLRLYNTKKDF